MPVNFAAQCPALLESDVLSLSPSLYLRKNVLHDTVIGARHTVGEEAKPILQLLQQGNVTYGHLVRSSQYTGEILGFLNMIGGLRRERRFFSGSTFYRHIPALIITGGLYSPLGWRQKTTPGNLLIGMLRAAWPVIFGFGIICGMVLSAGIINSRSVLLPAAFGIFIFVASVYLHEYAHIVTLRRANVSGEILQRGRRLAIIHPKLRPSQELKSAIAGPLVGALSCLAAIIPTLPHTPLGLYVAAVVIASFHILSLLPWYGDGGSIVAAQKEAYDGKHS